jgi:hypothetical protein
MMPRKYLEILVVAIASVGAVYAGSHIVTLAPPELALIIAIALVILWTLSAGDYWWTPVLVGATLTGVFKINFKIYPLDLSIVLGLLGLAPLLLVRGENLLQSHRRPLPFIFYLAAIYITVRMAIDILPEEGYRGSLGRVYFNSIWPFFFAWIFHHYGKLRVLRVALAVVFLFLIARAGAAIVGYVLDTPLYIPGINYVLSSRGEESLTPMRAVAFSLLIVCLIFFHSSRSFLARLTLPPVLAMTGALMLMGASRFMTLLFMILPVSFFAWRRNWFVCFLAGFMAASSLSGFIWKPEVSSAAGATMASNQWHRGLQAEGFRRWTESPWTFLFGYGLRPSPELFETNQYYVDPQTAVNISANVGAYESGLWTVLGLVGSLGFLLYALLFLYFLKRTMPYFLRRPRGTIWEGLIFWACFSSITWYFLSYYEGSFPSLELFLLILAADAVQDGLLDKKETPGRVSFSVPEEVAA